MTTLIDRTASEIFNVRVTRNSVTAGKNRRQPKRNVIPEVTARVYVAEFARNAHTHIHKNTRWQDFSLKAAVMSRENVPRIRFTSILHYEGRDGPRPADDTLIMILRSYSRASNIVNFAIRRTRERRTKWRSWRRRWRREGVARQDDDDDTTGE